MESYLTRPKIRFPGKPKINPISPRQLNQAFTSAKRMAGINNPATLHTLPVAGQESARLYKHLLQPWKIRIDQRMIARVTQIIQLTT